MSEERERRCGFVACGGSTGVGEEVAPKSLWRMRPPRWGGYMRPTGDNTIVMMTQEVTVWTRLGMAKQNAFNTERAGNHGRQEERQGRKHRRRILHSGCGGKAESTEKAGGPFDRREAEEPASGGRCSSHGQRRGKNLLNANRTARFQDCEG